ncbi:uncharacterized protein LOC129746626 isoform X2 [Uranotaenia lowii]|nr:uncharacterized protein LOC129746626 isoform X2 [Uranotaenia lowii]
MSTSGALKILKKLHIVALLLCIIFKYLPREKLSKGNELATRCELDTRELCPGCFRQPPDYCEFFRKRISVEAGDLLDQLVCRFNRHGVRYGLLDGQHPVVIKNLNDDGQVEKLRDSVCYELGIPRRNCRLEGDPRFLGALKRKVLEESLVEGCIVCPTGDSKALESLLLDFEENDLLDMVLMRVHVQPLLLKMFAKFNLPVPKFIFQGGFTLVESYDGDMLENFYNNPLDVRLSIAYELIDASLRLTSGVKRYRFYLTDINPDNIAVQILPSGRVKVSFIDLDNVIILDRHSKQIKYKKTAVHSRIDCDGCFAFVQEEICSHQMSDINSYAMCQLFLEDINGNANKGFLHTKEDRSELNRLHQLLHHCVYCVPPDCQDRQEVLRQVQDIIRAVKSR